MTTVTDIGSLITRSPGVCGRRVRIAGTGVSVRRIAGSYKVGLAPEEIATEIPLPEYAVEQPVADDNGEETTLLHAPQWRRGCILEAKSEPVRCVIQPRLFALRSAR